MCMPRCWWGDQNQFSSSVGNQFSSSIMWVPGIKFKLPVASAFLFFETRSCAAQA